MVRINRWAGVAALAALSAIVFSSPSPVSAVPTVIITKAVDDNDLWGGPYWLPPTESSYAPNGYYTDRSRHKNNDIHVEFTVESSSLPISVIKFYWLETSDPDGGSFTIVDSIVVLGPNEDGVYVFHTSARFPSPDPNKYYSFEIRAVDQNGSGFADWVKRAPGEDGVVAQRWVQLNCPAQTCADFANYLPYYLSKGSFGDYINTCDQGTKDRFRHDTATDFGHFDSGSMLWAQPGSQVERRWCELLINYWFDQTVTIPAPYVTLTNVYYHLWCSTVPTHEGSLYAKFLRTRGGTPALISQEPVPVERYATFYWTPAIPEPLDEPVNPSFALAVDDQDFSTNNYFSDNNIYELYLQLHDPPWHPACISSRRTPSFVIFNLPSRPILAQKQSDGDGLNDDYELYTIHTSPFLTDTDDDLQPDNIDPYPNDPYNLHIVNPNGGGTWTIGSVMPIQFTPVPAGCTQNRLFIKRGSQAWQQLPATLSPSLSQYNWTVTGPASSQCLIKEALNAADPGDPCDAPFVIQAGQVERTGRPLEVVQEAAGSLGTTISFGLAAAGDVSLAIYSVSGRLIETVTNGRLDEGAHSYIWNGTQADGHKVAPGVYFVRLLAPTRNETHRIVVMR